MNIPVISGINFKGMGVKKTRQMMNNSGEWKSKAAIDGGSAGGGFDNIAGDSSAADDEPAASGSADIPGWYKSFNCKIIWYSISYRYLAMRNSFENLISIKILY